MAQLTPEDEALVSGWLARTVERREEAAAAWDELTELSSTDLERGWRLALALIRRAPDEHLAAVGAGPLEDLLNAFPEEMASRSVQQARNDRRFREALSRAWISRKRIPASVREALVLATDGKILILDI